jgi:DNA-binding MarR family transcriptional regulator
MTAVYDGHLAEVGLTVGQYALLVNIGAETMPLSRLARRTATDRTTLTRTLTPLIKAGRDRYICADSIRWCRPIRWR